MKRDLSVPLYYDMSVADVAEFRLVGELLAGAQLGEILVRKLLGDLAYRSEDLGETLAGVGFGLVITCFRQHGARRQVEGVFSTLKRSFGIEYTLATTLIGLATRIGLLVGLQNRGLPSGRGRAKERPSL